jgi:hypothetical protein
VEGHSTNANHNSQILLQRSKGSLSSPATTADNDNLGQVVFGGYQGGLLESAVIVGKQDGAAGGSYIPAEMLFQTSEAEVDRATRMIIRANGNVGIGTTSPSTLLELALAQPLLTISSYAAAASTTGVLAFNSSTNATVGSHTVVDAEDQLGIIDFRGSDGDSFEVGARIMGIADETFSASARGSYLSFHTVDNTTTTLDERMRIDHNGNVGIGTTAPSTNLHVAATSEDAILRLTPFTSDNDAVIQLTGQGDNIVDEGFEIWYDNSIGDVHLVTTYASDAADIHFHTRTGASKSTSNERMIIQGNGNVGIGDSSPDALLSIKGDSDANTTPSIRLKDGSDTREAWITNESGDLKLVAGGNDNTPHCQITLMDGNMMLFKTSNDEKMRIDSSGNVGIGTVSPAAKLDVSGSIFPSGNGFHDLGSDTKRWNTVYTSDLSLKNDFGDWTIVEGEDNLFLYNNKKGKTYKFNLTEVDASEVPPKGDE